MILQADLTAVAAGPLAHDVAGELRLLAEQESRGGGGVYRFSDGSLRRAFDVGWSAGEVHDWLAEHSVTPVPQPLAYLVDDVARRHGSIRVGQRGCVPAVEDAAEAAALLAHRGRRRRAAAIAPGVLVAGGRGGRTRGAAARALGQAPAVEDEGGRRGRRRPACGRPTAAC